VRCYVKERLTPLEARVAEEDHTPGEVVDKTRRLGFFGLTTPEAYGGLGLTMVEEVLVDFDMGRCSPPSAPCSAPTAGSARRPS